MRYPHIYIYILESSRALRARLILPWHTTFATTMQLSSPHIQTRKVPHLTHTREMTTAKSFSTTKCEVLRRAQSRTKHMHTYADMDMKRKHAYCCIHVSNCENKCKCYYAHNRYSHTYTHARTHERTHALQHVLLHTDAHAPNILLYPYTNTRTPTHTHTHTHSKTHNDGTRARAPKDVRDTSLRRKPHGAKKSPTIPEAAA